MWRKGNSCTVGGNANCGATVENSMAASQKIENRDAWVAQLVKCLPLTQVMVSASWDQVPIKLPA